MSLNRRDFVKLCTGTVAGFGVAQMFHPAVREALAGTLTGERPPCHLAAGTGLYRLFSVAAEQRQPLHR